MDTCVDQGTNGTTIEDTNYDLHLELSKAGDKFQKRDEKAMANAGYGQTIGGLALTQAYHKRVTEAVEARLNSQERPRSNSYAFRLERVIRQLPPSTVALSLLQSCLSAACHERTTHREVCYSIGDALNDELFAAKLLQTDKRIARKINKSAKERFGSVKLRKAAAKREAEQAGFYMEDWSRPMAAHAGQWGLNILLATIPEVLTLSDPDGYKGERKLSITEGGIEQAKAAIAEVVCMSPVYQPRTERPKDWTGFRMNVAEDDRTMARADILRTPFKDVVSAARYAIGRGTMAPAVEAVNAMQSVPWKINTWIMDVIRECYTRGIAVEGLPLPTEKMRKVPPRLPAPEFNSMAVEARTLYAKTRNGLRRAKKTNDNDTIQYTEDMEIAQRLTPCERFYTPMNMDWRGRVYALTHFNFQRSDRVRALFLFADGAPIGERGLYWLKIHVANCGAFDKVDKKPMEDRIKWVDDNLPMLIDCVKRPLYRTDWTQADAPFLFLAAARELVTALATGADYLCHLPVSFDGSCNGLQHLCAMTRSTEGRLVNLTDNAIPEDVYQVVADLVKKMIEADLGDFSLFGKADEEKPDRKTVMPLDTLAKLVLPYVDRKLVKRNTMVFAYSSKEYGMSEQHMEDTMEPLDLKVLKGELKSHPFGESRDEWKLVSRYLAKRVLAAIRQVVSKPAEAMGFMQDIAKALAHEGKPVRWTSPSGVPCINRYHEPVTERLELWCYDKGVKDTVRTQITVAVDFESAVHKEKAASAIAPNFVHSMDAAALLLTVRACVAEGIHSIATVHDSFGCLPSQADRFNEIIREQFLKMYTDHDVLAELLESAHADLTPANHKRLPDLPEKGTLDLTEILRARYAFA